ncbi:GNAT family N-acetyltransferase [Nocardioides pacificus]
MRIRLAAASEYDAIGELVAAAYIGDGHVPADHDYVEQLRDTATRAAQAEVWVAVDGADDRLLGTVTNCPVGSSWREVSRDGEGEFRMLAVAREARGRGVGSALVEHCIEESRGAGDGAVVLCSLSDQTTAHRLYERMGFVRAPERDWYPEEGLALLVFKLPLRPEERPWTPT